ncbi:hypothetical protein C9374_014104 [Naegleria lovaniensis]|uniref:Glucosylceramidase n=1 Tax=Naegleria lovaniensis TaxID=51637 RepID=A0AA88KPV4_NAELO|nr:uncharacterized protein C9374_014104 [Naegleria lovaniensis]KAG2389544.1 hypothetical protein C9374_014104 [Naegleria lovaniensis]
MLLPRNKVSLATALWLLMMALTILLSSFDPRFMASSSSIVQAKQVPKFIRVIQTAQHTSDRLTPVAPLYFKKRNDVRASFDPSRIQQRQGNTDEPNIVLLNPNHLLQKIIGFGCAITESASFVFSTMNERLKQDILNLYWSPSGLNYTIGRIPMNSCDFALGTYSCDDTANDFELKDFSIQRDKLYKLPMALRVVNTTATFHGKPLKLFLSPWSPPAWMKTNHDMNGSGLPLGLINNTQVLKSWALYFSKYVEAYKREGINFWGLTVQNEPEYAAPYEACVYTAEYQRDFIKYYLGPLMKSTHPDVNIMIYDHNRDHVHLWAQTIYADKEAAKYVAGTAFHWYSDGTYEHLDLVYDMAPEKILLGTEATQGPNVNYGDWTRGESYGYDIINDLQHYAQGWTDWNCLLDAVGGPTHMNNWCDALIVANNKTQSLYLQPMYYYMGHFSKFILQDSRRISLVQSSNDLLVTSFLTPENNIVIVTMNNKDTALKLQLLDLNVGLDYYVDVELPPHSIRTMIYPYEK